MNKKVLFGTLLGIITGGVGLTLVFVNFLTNHENRPENLNKYKFLDIDLCIVSMVGGMLGTAFGKLVSEYIEQSSEREAYREFFEGQRIETNSNQLANESTPLLQEHIVNINEEENLLNISNISNHSHSNIL